MKIAICSDHRGFHLKSELVKKMAEKELLFEDYGCFNEERCDYPAFALKVAEATRDNKCDFGVVICGSGDGVAITANKVKGIRCVCARNVLHVKRAREHVNINVLALAAEETNVKEAFEMIQMLISTEFLYGRYEDRIKEIEHYEKRR